MSKTPTPVDEQDVWLDDEDIKVGARTDWARIAEKITANPGKWLLAKRGAPRSYVPKINNGEFEALNIPGYSVTATSRNRRGSGSDIWVKAEAL